MSVEVNGDGRMFFNGQEVAGVRAVDIATTCNLVANLPVSDIEVRSIRNGISWIAPCDFVGGRGNHSNRILWKPDGTSATGSISKVERKRRNKALKRAKQSRKVNRKR